MICADKLPLVGLILTLNCREVASRQILRKPWTEHTKFSGGQDVDEEELILDPQNQKVKVVAWDQGSNIQAIVDYSQGTAGIFVPKLERCFLIESLEDFPKPNSYNLKRKRSTRELGSSSPKQIEFQPSDDQGMRSNLVHKMPEELRSVCQHLPIIRLSKEWSPSDDTREDFLTHQQSRKGRSFPWSYCFTYFMSELCFNIGF